ncbi:MAG: hypothetical protein WHS65_05455 [Melioribacteraceae bacterium]
MKLKNILLIIVFGTLPLIISSCCGCKKIAAEEKIVKGYITVVGNEPFAKLALKTDEDKIYILKCSKELEEELYKQQGNYYTVEFDESRIEMDVPVINVIKAIPLEKENKGNK